MKKGIMEVFRHRKQIFEGITNALFRKDYIEEIAKERLSICLKCPLIDFFGDRCMIPGTQPCCSECGCKLSLKTRSLSSECPHPDGSRWEAILNEDEEDMLYKDLNYNPDQTPTQDVSNLQSPGSQV